MCLLFVAGIILSLQKIRHNCKGEIILIFSQFSAVKTLNLPANFRTLIIQADNDAVFDQTLLAQYSK